MVPIVKKLIPSLLLAGLVAVLAPARAAQAATITLFDAIPAAPAPGLGSYAYAAGGLTEVGQQIGIAAGLYSNVTLTALFFNDNATAVQPTTLVATLYAAPSNPAPGSNAGAPIAVSVVFQPTLNPGFNQVSFGFGTLNLPSSVVYGIEVPQDLGIGFVMNGDGIFQYSGPTCVNPDCALPTVGTLPLFSDPDYVVTPGDDPSSVFLRGVGPGLYINANAAAQGALGNFTSDCCAPTTTAVRLTGDVDAQVPEPGTLVLFASGLVGAGVVSYRKRRARS